MRTQRDPCHGQPAIIGFWYRQHSSEIVANSFPAAQSPLAHPANDEPGMIRAELDSAGRLLALEVRPDSIHRRRYTDKDV